MVLVVLFTFQAQLNHILILLISITHNYAFVCELQLVHATITVFFALYQIAEFDIMKCLRSAIGRDDCVAECVPGS